jgi:5-methylcytosine-specific restriction protein A
LEGHGRRAAYPSAVPRSDEWSDDELRTVAYEYFHVLREQEAGRGAVKQRAVDTVHDLHPHRTKHAVDARLRYFSQVLKARGLPWVRGWNPPTSQASLSTGASASIWRVVEPLLAEELPDVAGPTEDLPEVWRRAARMTWISPGSPPPVGQQRPERGSTEVARFVRDPAVVAWVSAQARGCCEGCGGRAPFISAAGAPYLEVHHVRRLADGGSDTVTNAVALCPNCHRRCHHCADPDAERTALYERVDRLVPESLGQQASP